MVCLDLNTDALILDLYSFASLDLAAPTTIAEFVRVCQALGIPGAFADERVTSVSHSFGSQTDDDGSFAWFHFLCKYITLQDGSPEVQTHIGPSPVSQQVTNTPTRLHLPQADYSYIRSGFFLRRSSDPHRRATLICFGETSATARLRQFINSGESACSSAIAEPLVLFDLILEGLFWVVDQIVFNMNRAFGALEHVR